MQIFVKILLKISSKLAGKVIFCFQKYDGFELFKFIAHSAETYKSCFIDNCIVYTMRT